MVDDDDDRFFRTREDWNKMNKKELYEVYREARGKLIKNLNLFNKLKILDDFEMSITYMDSLERKENLLQ